MSEMIRTVSKEMLAWHEQAASWQLEQAKVAEKQVATAFEVGRSTLEAQRDLAQRMGHTLVDAFAPEKAEAKA